MAVKSYTNVVSFVCLGFLQTARKIFDLVLRLLWHHRQYRSVRSWRNFAFQQTKVVISNSQRLFLGIRTMEPHGQNLRFQRFLMQSRLYVWH